MRQAHCPCAAFQVDVIKKAYLQEEECENAEVSPREVGHNIYILALQVRSCDSRAHGAPHAELGSRSLTAHVSLCLLTPPLARLVPWGAVAGK